MIIKLCAKCRKPIKYPNRFCSTCNEIHKEEEEINIKLRNKRYNQTRDKKYLTFYKSIDWNLLKNKKLQDTQYRCERCKELGKYTLAAEVHHLKPIQTDEGWVLRLDYNNLKSLCVECHNWYHKRFQRKEKTK